MSPDAAGGRVLVVYTEDGTCFEIPRDVVEKGRVEGERLAELHRLVEAGDVSRFSGGVVLPYAGDSAAYALSSETIARYRVSPERAAELGGRAGSDVEGYLFNCPPGTHAVFTGGSPWGSSYRCVFNTPVADYGIVAAPSDALRSALWR